MKATPITDGRQRISASAFIELAIWEVPSPVPPSEHNFKYRLALVVSGECVMRYDNERGKGDHRHYGDREERYTFTTLETLLADFMADVERLTQ